MLNGCYYLNNNGSRWVVYTDGKKEKVTLETKSGELITRTAIFYESFSNFGLVCISYKGKKIKVLLED